MKSLLLPLYLLACLTVAAHAELQSRVLTYNDGMAELKGYFVIDSSVEGPRPGVLVVHEWWGQNDHARKQADRLAEAGYAVMALDMYGQGKTTDHPEDAAAMSSLVRNNAPNMRRRFHAAMKMLQEQPEVKAGPVAAVGYCFGGAVVLDMARSGFDLAAVISMHGSLTPSDVKARPGIKSRILVCHGSEDSFIPQDAIEAFKEEMEEARANYEFLVLEGAQHSFTNPEADSLGIAGLAFDAEADRISFEAMLELLKDVFAD